MAGFNHRVLVEWNKDACATLRSNAQKDAVPGTIHWRVVESDIRYTSFSDEESVDLLAGGPPCQPFSIGGKHGGTADSRNMIPQYVRVVRELRPRALIFENVKGLLRPGFRAYFDYLLLQLRHLDIEQSPGESWSDHFQRLSSSRSPATYDLSWRLVNAADYGVPQTRERVLAVGFRSDLSIEWEFPEPTHSREALLFEQLVSGAYWRRHGIAPSAPAPDNSVVTLGFMADPEISGTRAWRTVRDALEGLPAPSSNHDSGFANHRLNPGARAYAGHTGSHPDLPAKTLKAGDHGVPGGENMLAQGTGHVRYFTVREAARIQTFPDSWVFSGTWSEAMRQLGNAVPVKLAETIAARVASALAQRNG